MSDWRFQEPLWLLSALPLVALTWLAIRRRKRTAMLYSSVQLLKTLPPTLTLRIKRAMPWIKLLGLILLTVALARPQYGLSELRVRGEGIAIQMCIDRSGSMEALDFQLHGRRINRLTAVKNVFQRFVTGDGVLPGRQDDLVGLVAFGGFAQGMSPLTLDHGALLQVLDSIETPQAVVDRQGRIVNESFLDEERATAIGDAVALAVDRLKETECKSKVVILLSDGENNAGVVDPREAASAAKTFGVRIYAIGVGASGRAPFSATDAFGRRRLVPQAVRLDVRTLKMLANETGGRYFNARNTRALEEVYADIDEMEKSTTERRLYTEYRELCQWFILPGLALVLLETLLGCTRFRSLP